MVDIWDILGYKIPYIDITIQSLLIAIVITIIAWIVLIGLVMPFVRKAFERMKLPPLLSGLIVRVIRVLLVIVILLVFLSTIGIDVSSLVLTLGAVIGLVLAFGMSDSMNNFFAGVWIAIIRPFRKDDVVEVSGHTGKVNAVGIMVTELLTPDNIYIAIPNRQVWGEAVKNYTRMPIRRVNTDVGIAYGSDVTKAYELSMRLMKEHEKVLEEPAPSIYMTELADSSVNLQLRPWSKTEDYWDVLHDLRIALHEELPKAGIEIPFPQLDVHMVPVGGAPVPGM